MALGGGISFTPSIAALNFLIRFTAITRGITGGLSEAQKKALAELRKTEIAARSATLGLSAPLIALGGISFATALSFEDAFSGIEKTVDGTEQQLQSLKEELKDLSTKIPVSFRELALIGELGGQFQVPINQLRNFIEATARLVATTRLTSEGAATAIARFMSAFPEDDIFRITSLLIDMGDITVGTEQQLIDIIKRLGPAAKELGFTAADVAAFASQVLSAGGNVESSATNLRKFLTQLTIITAQGGKKLKALNKLFTRFGADTSKTFQEAFKEDKRAAILKLIASMTELRRIGQTNVDVLLQTKKATAETFGSSQRLFQVLDALNKTAGEGSKTFLNFVERMKIAQESFAKGTSLFEKSDKKFRTGLSTLKRLTNLVLLSAGAFGQIFLTALKTLEPALAGFFGAILILAKAFENINPILATAIAAFITLAAVIPPIIALFVQLKVAAILLNGSLATTVLLMGGMVLATAILSASIVAIILLLIEAKKTFGDWGSFAEFILIRVAQLILAIPLVFLAILKGIFVSLKFVFSHFLILLGKGLKKLKFIFANLGDEVEKFGKALDKADISKHFDIAAKPFVEARQKLEDIIIEKLVNPQSEDDLIQIAKTYTKGLKDIANGATGVGDQLKDFNTIFFELSENLANVEKKAEILGARFDKNKEKLRILQQALNEYLKTVIATGERDKGLEEIILGLIDTTNKAARSVQELTFQIETLGNFLDKIKSEEDLSSSLLGASNFPALQRRVSGLIDNVINEARRKSQELKKRVSPLSVLLSDPQAQQARKEIKQTALTLAPLLGALNQIESDQDPIRALENKIKLTAQYIAALHEVQFVLGISSKELEQTEALLRSTLRIERSKLEVLKKQQALLDSTEQFFDNLIKARRELSFEFAFLGEGKTAEARIERRLSTIKSILSSVAGKTPEELEQLKILLPDLIDEFDRLSVAKKKIEQIGKAFSFLEDNINSTISSSVDGILRGTTTIQQAWVNLLENLIVSFISSMAQLLVSWTLTQLKMLLIQELISRKIIAIKGSEVAQQAAIEKLKTLVETEEGAKRVLSALGENAQKLGLKTGEAAAWTGVEAEKTEAEAAGAATRSSISLTEIFTTIAAKLKEGAIWVAVELKKLAATTFTMATSIAQIFLAALGMSILAVAATVAAIAFAVLAISTGLFLVTLAALATALVALVPVLAVELLALSAVLAIIGSTMIAVVGSFAALLGILVGMAGTLLVAAMAAGKLAIALAAASVAGIPIIGAALAPLAAAATSAALSSAAGALRFARGGIVPGFGLRDTVPAMLSPGEMVLPPDLSQGLQDMVESGGESGVTVVVNAIDTDGVRKFINRNKRQFAKAVRQEVRNFNPDVYGSRRTDV